MLMGATVLLLGLATMMPAQQQQDAGLPFGGAITVRSFDVRAEGNSLSALILGQFQPDEAPRLAYVEASTHSGRWNPPRFIDTALARPISSRGNDVQLAAAGHRRVAVFQVMGEFPGNGPLMVAVSEDDGQHWESGILPVMGDPQQNQSYPDVEIDETGAIHLVWLDDREENGSTQGLRSALSRDGGRHWQEEGTVDMAVCTCCSTRLTRLPDAKLALLYRDHAPQDMRLAVRKPNNHPWQLADRVGTFNWQIDGCPHTSGGLASSLKAGEITLHAAIWTGEDQYTGVHYLKSSADGQDFKTRQLIDTHGSDPDIATRPEQAVAIAYRHGSGKDSRIALVKSENGGKDWSTPAFLSAPGLKPDHPRIVPTPQGFRVFWTERLNGGDKRLASASLDSSS